MQPSPRLDRILALAACTTLLACGNGRTMPATDGGGGVDLGVNTCVGHCSAPGSCCGNPVRCIDTSADRNNCGKCSNVCAPGTNCVGGACRCPGSNTVCGAESTCCPNVGCKNLKSDNQNCGQCNRACADGESCAAGVCSCGGKSCAMSESCCAGKCLDVNQNDVLNCGACGTECPKGATCSKGMCSEPPKPDGGVCMCAKKCMLGGCLAGCCPEDIIGMKCNPDPKCLGLMG